ncbi:unannotated protein [freshwater metagenome]|uniref:Unannotated protein n=1 Tax=freshwater metagenome TaxID=449393 RepID=A0A6J7IRV5_9ZZZZ
MTAEDVAQAGDVTGLAQDVADAGEREGEPGYTRVLHDVPAVVLLVDLGDRSVVHANPAARALTPGLGLPASATAWTAAAGITAPGGGAYEPGESPVERAVAGSPVFGEPVVAREGDRRRPLWVTGFPIPTDGTDLALLVLFDVQTDLPEAQIRDRAVVAAGLSFTIADPRQPDSPLVYVNPAFERTTGYDSTEVLGRNCRFLQGPDTDPAAVQRVREALRGEEHALITLLNYRKDGTAFWNELSLSPVYDGHGELTHFVGIQADVTARVTVEQERERHLASEQRARTSAEKAQRRLALLAEATSMLAATLDVEQSLERLTQLVVPMMADWCTVHLLAQDGEVERTASTHADPSRGALLDRLEQIQPTALNDRSATNAVLAGGPPVLVKQVTPEMLRDRIDDEELLAVYEELGYGSAVVVPLRARNHVLGALTLMTDGSGRTFDEDDLTMAADLARRAALTVDNARLYQREHDVAEALQRSLLPQLPEVEGLDVAARYLPGSTAAQVGGDWYDLFPLPDGTVGLAVGDVMGHDLTAAAAMGQLRSVLRSYAWQGESPALVLDHLDQLVQGLEMAQLATALYGRLSMPVDGRPGELRLANAGHLPPVLRAPDGTTRLLDEAESLLVGAALGIERTEVSIPVEPGSMLVLYTDGLVEQRGVDPDAGLERLRRAVSELDTSGGAKGACDELLDALDGRQRDDDVALLVVCVDPLDTADPAGP